jgi:hypothetical protein
MTKNLKTLCDLFDNTDIDYKIIADNEISVEVLSLGLERKNPQNATDEDLDEGLWLGNEYIHICESSLGLFSITVVTAIGDDNAAAEP